MLSNSNEVFVIRRLHVVLKFLIDGLNAFVESDGANATPFIFVRTDEAKTAAKYLLQLNLNEDAMEIATAWIKQRDWFVGPGTDEILASIAADDPKWGKRFRNLLGIPQPEELDVSSQERRRLKFIAVAEARDLLNRLRQIQEAISHKPAPQAMNNELLREPTKTARAIVIKRMHPELTDKDVADAVACDPSTLSGSPDYRAARDAIAAEHAKRLNRSRRHRGTDMDEYPHGPDK
jgi:hypothetical protein